MRFRLVDGVNLIANRKGEYKDTGVHALSSHA